MKGKTKKKIYNTRKFQGKTVREWSDDLGISMGTVRYRIANWKTSLISTPRRRHESHASTQEPEYKVWRSMKDRCTNQNNKQWKDYGERGIECCPQWLDSYTTFRADMGRRPKGGGKKWTIERIDNDAGYSPDNCVWATRTANSRNRRDNHLVTYNGETLCVTEWAARMGFTHTGLLHRLNRMDVEGALTLPKFSR